MTLALSSWLVIADGRGSSFANSRNSAFSFSLLVRAAFLDFSFIAIYAVVPDERRGDAVTDRFGNIVITIINYDCK